MQLCSESQGLGRRTWPLGGLPETRPLYLSAYLTIKIAFELYMFEFSSVTGSSSLSFSGRTATQRMPAGGGQRLELPTWLLLVTYFASRHTSHPIPATVYRKRTLPLAHFR